MALTVSVPCSMWKWLDLEIHENVCLLATGYFPLQYHPAWLSISSVKKRVKAVQLWGWFQRARHEMLQTNATARVALNGYQSTGSDEAV